MPNKTLEEPPAVRRGGRRKATRRWALDADRSTVEFRVLTFRGLSAVVGHFDRFGGFYGLDPEDVLAIELTIDARSVDTGNRTRDRHLRSKRFFDVSAHPLERFSSTLINELDGTIAISGQREAAGRVVPLALEATVWEAGDELEIEATTTVDQPELGMTFSPLGVNPNASATLHGRARLTPDRGQS